MEGIAEQVVALGECIKISEEIQRRVDNTYNPVKIVNNSLNTKVQDCILNAKNEKGLA